MKGMEWPLMKKLSIIPGEIYGRLTVIRKLNPKKAQMIPTRKVKALCTCGNYTTPLWINVHSSIPGPVDV
jgi:hypothetical protein